MMDGSTDISGDEQETIYVRFVDKGTVHEHFLDIGSPISTCSQNLYEHVISTFQKRGIHDHAKGEITLFFLSNTCTYYRINVTHHKQYHKKIKIALYNITAQNNMHKM